MRSKPCRRPAAGVSTVDRMCSNALRSSRALTSWQSTLNTLVPESAGRPIDGGTARQPWAWKTCAIRARRRAGLGALP
eukprot:15456222-Alexandrium_andersonii.AAC.1